MRPRNRAWPLAVFLAAAALLPLACHTIREELPTRPSATPAPLIPVAPIPAAPQPTPRPTPGPPGAPSPDEDPLPAGGGGSCSAPLPDPASQVNVKVHIVGASRLVLDATPLVGPDDAYCRQVGFTDGRRFCPTRAEGHPERAACDALVSGSAADTGRPGPTWKLNGGPCVFANGCENHPDNQFLAFAYGPGTYSACVASGACGSLAVTE